MIDRILEAKLKELAGYYPVVLLTGPRQSGKTTICKKVFSDKPYVSLEAIDVQDYVRHDPRGFLQEYAVGAVLDEIQHVPDLLSYLQTDVDENPQTGRFILTGSQHFGLSQSVSQTLAGRCGNLVLLPPSLQELNRFSNAPGELFETLWQGAYPRIYDRNIPAHQWLADYTTTYIQRDARQVINIGDLQAFTDFLKLCAGRTGQEINLSKLGNDTGISHNTAKAWLSVLESSYIVYRLRAWHTNIRKQMVKAPKLHFLDSGLVCYLLGIRDPEQLRHHPLRGAIFESWVVSEIYKSQIHSGETPRLFHYRETRGLEIDLLIEKGLSLDVVEIKSGATVSQDFFANFERFSGQLKASQHVSQVQNSLVYGGETSRKQSNATLLAWKEVHRILSE